VSPLYLADTNVLSEGGMPRPNPGVVAAMQRHQHQIVTAAPAWQELLFGVHRLPPSRRRVRLELLLDDLRREFPILPYDTAAAEWHATERARLTALGRTPPFVDGQIAAIAYTNDLTLVTANVADFTLFRGLRVEDWRSTET
jgi:tRNA(fMet)-specific endonuclease VapC